MKILIVSNLYPPYYGGGYEVRCAQVAEALQHSGHDVCVLTSTYGLPASALGNTRPRCEERNGVPVHRALNHYLHKPQPVQLPGRLFAVKRHLWDAQQFQQLVKSFQPDIVNWWGMYSLSKTLLPLPHAWGIPDVHWIEHWWMIREYGPAGEIAAALWSDCWDGNWGPRICRPLFRWGGRRWERRFDQEDVPTRSFPNRPSHVCFVSEYLRTLYRDEGFDFPSSEVIYGGVPTALFYAPIHGLRDAPKPLRCLYAGQISPDRGLHTVIEAIGHMDFGHRSRLRLSIAGHSTSAYFTDIKARVAALGLTETVAFLGQIPHEQMPGLYKQHHVLVFPSTREEGLPLTMIEAMLSGCAVVTTGSGGAMEVATLADLPVFPKNNSAALSHLITQLVTHREQVPEIASRGQKIALQEFSLDRMMRRFGETLDRIYTDHATRVAGRSQQVKEGMYVNE